VEDSESGKLLPVVFNQKKTKPSEPKSIQGSCATWRLPAAVPAILDNRKMHTKTTQVKQGKT